NEDDFSVIELPVGKSTGQCMRDTWGSAPLIITQAPRACQ
ncbi:MAG: hypothetical protein ACI9UA_006039, partial [Pseudoalteromonas tetraodonis]